MENKEDTPVHIMVNHYKSIGVELDKSIFDLLLELQDRFFKDYYQKGLIEGLQRSRFKDIISDDKDAGMMFRDMIMNAWKK